ncbi:MAG: Uma2 family endonuclease [Vicinamibacteria bacterium]
MATTIRGTATEADLWNAPKDGRTYELVDGHILMSPGGYRHGQVGLAIGSALLSHVRAHRAGHVLDSSTGFRLPGGNVRSPDASFVASARAPQPPPDDFASVVPDLVVEVLSPSERPAAVDRKIAEYFAAGVRLVWVVEPRTRSAVVHAPGRPRQVLDETGALEGEDVLPGFRCALTDLLD